MKLFIVLSVIACGYAAKLDRTYLPPASAATAGGSPGSLTAPPGPQSNAFSSRPLNEGFGQQAPNFGSSGANGFAQPAQSTGFGKTGPSNFGQSSFGQQSSVGQPGIPSNQYGPPSSSGLPARGSSAPGFGSASSGQSQDVSSGPAGGRSPSASGFGPTGYGQSQDGTPQFQPERPQAAADKNAEILRYENENDGNTFAYNFETSNGISAEESGVATNGVQAHGGYSYTADDGEVYKVTYTADENGYQPQGDHLPTSPPIPDEILRSIEENARAAAAGTQEGAYQPDADDSPQQYAGSSLSYKQGQSAAQSYNQGSAQAQQYGAPNVPGRGSNQGLSQQYGIPASSGRVPSQGPSQQYNFPSAPIGSAPSAAPGPSGSFSQSQSGPKNQFTGSFGGSQATPGRVSNQGSQQFGSQSNFASSGHSGSFTASRQDQSSAQSLQGDQGYKYNRPQGPTRSFSHQDQSSLLSRPTQQYGAPTAFGSGSNQAPSQQFGTPTTPGASNRVLSQNYGAPSTSGRGTSQGPSQQYNSPSAPISGSSQAPSQEYGTPSTTGFGSNQGTQRLESPTSSSAIRPFSTSRQDQPSAQGTFGQRQQAQDDNGYQYNRPQGAPFGQGPNAFRPQSPGQNQNQQTAPQYNQPAQSGFTRPGATSNQGVSPPSSFGTGPTTGPAAALVSQSLLPGSRGNGQVSRPSQSSFGSSSGPAQGSFGSTQGTFGFQPQGSTQYRPGQSGAKDSMPESAPNQYNRPGAPSRQPSQPNQSSFVPATPTFGGPRQPPSFSPEQGYVY